MPRHADPRRLTPAVRRGLFVLLALVLAAGAALLFRQYGLRSNAQVTKADAEVSQASQRSALCSDTNASGVGLRGEYFVTSGLNDAPLIVRTDSVVDFDPAADFKEEGGNRRFQSARWTGWVKPPISGRYRFHLGETVATITVSRQIVAGPGVPADAFVELTAGQFAPIRVELDQIPALGGRVRLEWTPPFGSRFVVPRAALFLPADTAPAK